VPQSQRRRYVRDGEVPVTVLRRDHHPDGEHGANQLDAARQAIRSEAAARERAERSLAEAQVLIRDLQTKLAHERLAKDEALETVGRLETDKQTVLGTLHIVKAALAAERLARRNSEDSLAKALEACREAESRLLDAMAGQQVQSPPQAHDGLADATRSRRKAPALLYTDAEWDANDATRPTVPERERKANGPAIVDDGVRTIRARRCGRGAAGEQESEIVKWWKPRSTATGDTDVGSTSHKRGRGRPKGSKNRPKP
jgi:hypothetical protein